MAPKCHFLKRGHLKKSMDDKSILVTPTSFLEMFLFCKATSCVITLKKIIKHALMWNKFYFTFDIWGKLNKRIKNI